MTFDREKELIQEIDDLREKLKTETEAKEKVTEFLNDRLNKYSKLLHEKNELLMRISKLKAALDKESTSDNL